MTLYTDSKAELTAQRLLALLLSGNGTGIFIYELHLLKLLISCLCCLAVI